MLTPLMSAVLATSLMHSPLAGGDLQREAFQGKRLAFHINLPAAATVMVSAPNEPPSYLIRDGKTPPTWTMRIALGGQEEGISPKEAMAEVLAAEAGKGGSFEVLSNQLVVINGTKAAIAWMNQEAEQGQEVTRGWLIAPRPGGEMLVVSAITIPKYASTVMALLQESFLTLRMQNPAIAHAQRQLAQATAQAWISGLDAQDLMALDGMRLVHRIYHPSQSPQSLSSQEVGYTITEYSIAPLSALEDERTQPAEESGAEDVGLLVIYKGRFIQDAARQIFSDTYGRHWISMDTLEERWTLRSTQRQHAARRSEAETGIRLPASVGNPRAMTTIIRANAQTMERSPVQWETPDPFLPRTLGWVLGKLLPDHEASLAWWVVDSHTDQPTLALRQDEWTHHPTNPKQWQLTTWIGERTTPAQSTWNSDGNLIKLVHADGTITEPIAEPALRDLWLRAGLIDPD
jgi:hypothetical protein